VFARCGPFGVATQCHSSTWSVPRPPWLSPLLALLGSLFHPKLISISQSYLQTLLLCDNPPINPNPAFHTQSLYMYLLTRLQCACYAAVIGSGKREKARVPYVCIVCVCVTKVWLLRRCENIVIATGALLIAHPQTVRSHCHAFVVLWSLIVMHRLTPPVLLPVGSLCRKNPSSRGWHVLVSRPAGSSRLLRFSTSFQGQVDTSPCYSGGRWRLHDQQPTIRRLSQPCRGQLAAHTFTLPHFTLMSLWTVPRPTLAWL